MLTTKDDIEKMMMKTLNDLLGKIEAKETAGEDDLVQVLEKWTANWIELVTAYKRLVHIYTMYVIIVYTCLYLMHHKEFLLQNLRQPLKCCGITLVQPHSVLVVHYNFGLHPWYPCINTHYNI